MHKNKKVGAHRADVLNFVQKKLAIAGEYQPQNRADFTQTGLADKLTRIAKQEVKTAPVSGPALARAAKSQGDNSKSAARVKDAQALRTAVESVHKQGTPHSFVLVGYVPGNKDLLQYESSGQGLDQLKQHFPKDTIVYALLIQPVKEQTQTINKVC